MDRRAFLVASLRLAGGAALAAFAPATPVCPRDFIVRCMDLWLE